MSHVEDNPKLPCKRCKHVAERHRNIPAQNHSFTGDPLGPWTPQHVYCNESIYIYSGGGYTNGNCGCDYFDPMDNLEYLETLI